MNENFFALGGDSLLAIQCVSRLRDKIAVRVTLTDFFENGTVAEQAALIRERPNGGPPAGSIGGESVGRCAGAKSGGIGAHSRP